MKLENTCKNNFKKIFWFDLLVITSPVVIIHLKKNFKIVFSCTPGYPNLVILLNSTDPILFHSSASCLEICAWLFMVKSCCRVAVVGQSVPLALNWVICRSREDATSQLSEKRKLRSGKKRQYMQRAGLKRS